MFFLVCNEPDPPDLPEPFIEIFFSNPFLFINSSLAIIAAAAPSENGQASNNFNGSATIGDFNTSSTVIFF